MFFVRSDHDHNFGKDCWLVVVITLGKSTHWALFMETTSTQKDKVFTSIWTSEKKVMTFFLTFFMTIWKKLSRRAQSPYWFPMCFQGRWSSLQSLSVRSLKHMSHDHNILNFFSSIDKFYDFFFNKFFLIVESCSQYRIHFNNSISKFGQNMINFFVHILKKKVRKKVIWQK